MGCRNLPCDGTRVQDGVLLPAEQAGDAFALRVILVPGGHDVARGERPHDLADPDRGRIIGDRADPSSHCRIDGEVFVPDKDLSVGKFWYPCFREVEILGLRDSGGPRFENDLPGDFREICHLNCSVSCCVNSEGRRPKRGRLLSGQTPSRKWASSSLLMSSPGQKQYCHPWIVGSG